AAGGRLSRAFLGGQPISVSNVSAFIRAVARWCCCHSPTQLVQIAAPPRTAEASADLASATALEQYQQLGRVRRPQCRSAAIAGDGRLDALADPRLVSKRLADPQRDH